MPHRAKLQTVSLLVPSDWEDMQGKSQYTLSLLASIEGVLAAQGFKLKLLRLRDNETDSDLEAFEAHLALEEPAGIILARVLERDSVLDLLRRRAIPFVIFGHNPESDRDFWTDIDNRAAFWLTTRKCIDLGHKRIALLNGPEDYSYAAYRLAGYRAALSQSNIAPDTDLILNGQPTFAMGSVMASYLLQLKVPPTALVCTTDEMAMGAMYACADLGLTPGVDISVVGYGDSHAGASSTPRLATVSFDLGRVGEQLARQLLYQLIPKRRNRISIHQLLPVTWIEGASLSSPAKIRSGSAEESIASVPPLLAQRNAALNRAQQVVHAGNWSYNTLSATFVGSPEFCSILGLVRDSSISLTEIKRLVEPDDLQKFERAWRRALLGRPFDVEVHFKVDGVSRVLQWRGEFVCNQADLVHAEGAVQDVSDAAAVRQELEVARNEALEANRAKDLFLANISHEIRTPIHAILGLTDLLSRQQPAGVSLNTVDKISRSGKNLLNIINDILLISKVESNALTVDDFSFDLQTLVDDLAASAEGLLGNKSVKLILPQIDQNWRYLRGDPSRLSQVLLNLLGNACKFTAAGEIELGIEALPADRISNEVQLEFCVRDTGIGVPPEKLRRLFEPFTQADTSISRKYGGTGLGLSIVDSLVKLMGGKVEVESKPNHGSTFSFVLRFEISTHYEAHPLTKDQLKVLIVDDSAASRLHAAQVVLELGWSATAVESGIEALNELTGTPDAYDLMLLDFTMPGMSGLEVAKQVRASASASELQIIVLSSQPRHSLDAALSHFVDGFLLKPLNSADLLDVMAGENANIAATQRDSVGSELEGVTILCVDDSPINLDLLEDMLTSLGARVETASDGESALKRVRQGDRFDLLLSDIQMPGMDGFELTRRIHQVSGCESLPVIGVSAGVDERFQLEARSSGMAGYLAKPFDLTQLLSAVKPILSGEAKVFSKPLDSGTERAVLNFEFALNSWSKRSSLAKQYTAFLQQYADQDRLVNLIDLFEYDEALQLSHKLKGIAGVLGLERLADAAKALESTLREADHRSDSARVSELAAEAAAAHGTALVAIKNWLESEPSVFEGLTQQSTCVTTDALLSALDAHDPVKTEMLIGSQVEGVPEELVEEVRKAVAVFDFTHAASLLRGAVASSEDTPQNSVKS